MREIKFRGKRIDTEEWCYGYLFYGYNGWDEYVPFITWQDDSYAAGCGEEAVQENTIGQYTGLKDKNGKEIYEGDVVLEYKTKYIVRYEPTRGGFFPFACGDGCGCCDDEVVYNSKDVEIIGNIYDNPELLKEE